MKSIDSGLRKLISWGKVSILMDTQSFDGGTYPEASDAEFWFVCSSPCGAFSLRQSDENGDTYKFRTSPLRNLAVQPAFFHNGAFTSLSDALHHHLDAVELGPHYDPVRARVAADLTHNTGPIAGVATSRSGFIKIPPLSEQEFSDLLAFLRDGLLDPRARPEFLRRFIPTSVPSQLPLQVFESTPTRP